MRRSRKSERRKPFEHLASVASGSEKGLRSRSEPQKSAKPTIGEADRSRHRAKRPPFERAKRAGRRPLARRRRWWGGVLGGLWVGVMGGNKLWDVVYYRRASVAKRGGGRGRLGARLARGLDAPEQGKRGGGTPPRPEDGNQNHNGLRSARALPCRRQREKRAPLKPRLSGLFYIMPVIARGTSAIIGRYVNIARAPKGGWVAGARSPEDPLGSAVLCLRRGTRL